MTGRPAVLSTEFPSFVPAMADFRRRHRMTTSRHYRDVFDHRNRCGSRYFTFYRLSNGLGFHRLGLAVSRKVSKSAVRRNRIKRVIRESFRMALERPSEGSTGVDVVVVAKPFAADAGQAELRRDLDRHWISLHSWTC